MNDIIGIAGLMVTREYTPKEIEFNYGMSLSFDLKRFSNAPDCRSRVVERFCQIPVEPFFVIFFAFSQEFVSVVPRDSIDRPLSFFPRLRQATEVV